MFVFTRLKKVLVICAPHKLVFILIVIEVTFLPQNMFGQKTDKILKERDEAIKAKEHLMRELHKANSDVSREREYLQQQLEELKVNDDADKIHLMLCSRQRGWLAN